MFKKILISLIVSMFIFGAGRFIFAQSEEIDTKPSASETVSAENVGNKICPVSGEKIDEKTKATYEHKGKIYNFCCPMCLDEFKKDPEKYIKKVEEELQAESKEEVEHKMQMEHETESAGD
ncbi:MAG: YHS domain-containing protein [Candidatus Omnitrophota bacterium]